MIVGKLRPHKIVQLKLSHFIDGGTLTDTKVTKTVKTDR